KVTIPGYLVKKGEEEMIEYHVSSPLTNDMHPSRPKPEDLERQRLAEKAREERAAERAAPGRRGAPRGPPRNVKMPVAKVEGGKDDVTESKDAETDDEEEK
ncbi:MAG: hypothetical protein JSV94_05570, partial [Methanobacteriota archaeon]